MTTSTSTSLSPDTNTRYTHLLNPTSDHQPRSFGFSTINRSSSIRNTIKKIPSSLFGDHHHHIGDNAKEERKPAKLKSSRDRLRVFVDNSSERMTVDSIDPPQAPQAKVSGEEKQKPRTKTRKALAVLGWGTKSNIPKEEKTKESVKPLVPKIEVPPPISPVRSIRPIVKPTSARKPVPSLPIIASETLQSNHFPSDSQRPIAEQPAVLLESTTVLPPRQTVLTKPSALPPKPMATKPTPRGLTAWTSLKPPSDPIADSVRRPSLGEDPFFRREAGAQVVDHVGRFASDSSVKRGSGGRKSGSIKALSVKTVDELFGTAHKQSTASQRNVSTPLASKALMDLPPRSTSLNKVLDEGRLHPISNNNSQRGPQDLAAIEQPHSLNDHVPIRSLKREKTKSRIWGLLGGKSRKVKHKMKGDELAVATAEVRAQDAAADESVDFEFVQAYVPRSSLQRSHRPPALHISKPSTGDNTLLAQLSPISTIPEAILSASSGRSFNTLKKLPPPPEDCPFIDHQASTPLQGGVYESVAGTFVEHSSSEGPSEVVRAPKTSKTVPRRKSLSGLFGIAIKRSMERIKLGHGDAIGRVGRAEGVEESRPPALTIPKLRSLAEELEDATQQPGRESFISRSGESTLPGAVGVQSEVDLQQVASATDMLFNLVTCFDFSRSNTPSTVRSRISPLAHKPSLSSLRPPTADSHSPTPMRRIKSAMLATHSPAKIDVSPLKLALHRAHVKANMSQMKTGSSPTSAPRSLLKSGMRNPFAPPSPLVKAGRSTLEVTDDIDPEMETVGMPMKLTYGKINRRNITGKSLREDSSDSENDVPSDLQRIIMESEGSITHLSHRSDQATLRGLPPPPRPRPSPRHTMRQAPRLALPPLPLHLTEGTSQPVVDFVAARDSMLSDMLSPTWTGTENRNSFDFTEEYANLDQGRQRESFVEAVKRVNSSDLLVASFEGSGEDGFMSGVQSVSERLHTQPPTQNYRLSQFADALEEPTPAIEVKREKKSSSGPFQGQPAFQFQVSQRKQSNPPPEDPLDETTNLTSEYSLAPPAPQHRRRHHKRDESGMSIATMSSVGAVIETGIAGNYTNYFEAEFSEALAKTRSRQEKRASISSITSVSRERAPTRRHHHRNSFIMSIDSVGGFDITTTSNGPPISFHNNRRSYISKHRRDSSVDSALGRPDWASHRHQSSSIDMSRLIRPGLGDRMFLLDGGVQLNSITGSPPDNGVKLLRPSSESLLRSPEYDLSVDSLLVSPTPWSPDSLMASPSSRDIDIDSCLASPSNEHPQATNSFRFSQDSGTTYDRRSSTDADSLFGARGHANQQFLLKGLRPISVITDSSSENPDDTFTRARVIEKETCLQGEGQDASTETPIHSGHEIGRQLLSSSIKRPRKPRSSRKARPPNLIFAAPLSTPGLTSPSTSETSSRLSFDTLSRFSEGPSISIVSASSFSRSRPKGFGHHRQKSSAGVKLHATIREEPSIATLRANGSPKLDRQSSRSTIERSEDENVTLVKSWLELKREADDECRKTRDAWQDSVASQHALEDFQVPMTMEGIAAFLARSNQAYKPLDQLPIGERVAHRRKSSLSEARGTSSPYSLPSVVSNRQIFKPRASLMTKFERTNSATSSVFTFGNETDDSLSSAPVSAVFAQFTRETPPSPPPSLISFAPLSPFKIGLSREEKEAEEKKEKEKKRGRVTSTARRQALGWGRKKTENDPEETSKGKAATQTFFGRPKNLNLPPVPVLPKNANEENALTKNGNDEAGRPARTRAKSASAKVQKPMAPVRGIRL